jgi:hypothetical protein
MKLEDVRQGTRVKYAGGDGQEHDAVALSAPLLGFSNAIHGGSHFLNLIYLDEAGIAVKVPAAPLLTEAAGSDDLHAHAELTVPASRKSEERELQVQAEQFRSTKEPRTIGWRPYREDEFEGIVATLTLEHSLMVARIQVLEADLSKAQAELAAAAPVIPAQGVGGGEPIDTGMSTKDKALGLLKMLADPNIAKYVSAPENSQTIGRIIADALAGEPVDGNDNPAVDTGVNEYNQLPLDLSAVGDPAEPVPADAPALTDTPAEESAAEPIPTVDVTADPIEAGSEPSSDTRTPADCQSTLPEPSTDQTADPTPETISDPEPIATE